jgi:hypothetical protein
MAVRIGGLILILFGFLFCLSIIGAFIGIPMIIVGLVLLVVGGRRKTIITNVVQVSNTAAGPAVPASNTISTAHVPIGDAFYEPRLINSSASFKESGRIGLRDMREASDYQSPQSNAQNYVAYDLAKWNALVQYDDDIARIEAALKPYGQKYIDQFAAAYLALNDKQYLPIIIQKIIATAKQDSAQRA